MTHTIFIDGAAGTTGLEIRARLAERDCFSLIELSEQERKQDAARRDALNSCDIAILCLPDEAAREAVAMIDNRATRVIDASSAHRVSNGWAYGFPELVGRDTIANADRVSNPGCFPTGFLALLAPLVRQGLLPADWAYSCHATSGFSGGGKGLIGRYESDPHLAYRAYSLRFGHKHLPEMQTYAALRHAPMFAPSVTHAYRGMITSIPLHLAAMSGAARADALRSALAEYYDDRETIAMGEADKAELILRSDAPAWDGMELFVFADAKGTQAQLVARYDNLGKGASGAAVQNLNLMTGEDEVAGLKLASPTEAG